MRKLVPDFLPLLSAFIHVQNSTICGSNIFQKKGHSMQSIIRKSTRNLLGGVAIGLGFSFAPALLPAELGTFSDTALAACVTQPDTTTVCSGASTGETVTGSSADSMSVIADSTFQSTGTFYLDGLYSNSDISFSQEEGSTIIALGNSGVLASNLGAGSTTITTAGFITAINTGLLTSSYGTDVTINQTAGTISGGGYGMNISNQGTGATTITTSGMVEGFNRYGIYNTMGSSTTDLTINQVDGSIRGLLSGIYAFFNNNTGATNISTAGIVSGAQSHGIEVKTSYYGTGLTITQSAGSISGEFSGIYAQHGGSGEIDISTAGDIFGRTNCGILISPSVGPGLNLTQIGGNITGGRSGIGIVSSPITGLIFIHTAGDVVGLSAHGIDMVAGNFVGHGLVSDDAENVDGVSSSAGGLTIEQTGGSIWGYLNGINDVRGVAGPKTITVAGNVTGETDSGIRTGSNISNDSLTLTQLAGTISGGEVGIHVTSSNSNSLKITTAGNVIGKNGSGISFSESFGGDHTISQTAGLIQGGDDGIYVVGYDGSTTVTTAGTVAGLTSYGIFANSFASLGEANFHIVQTAGTIFGAQTGIGTDNRSAGTVTIHTASSVVGETAYGILARTLASAQGISVFQTAGSITGGLTGLELDNAGSGATTVWLESDVIGQQVAGVNARNRGNATDITITQNGGRIYGLQTGIMAENAGKGATILSIAGDVIGTQGNGVHARNLASATALTITQNGGTISGEQFGIQAHNAGTGTTHITAAGKVTGFESGIYAQNVSTADLLIDTRGGVIETTRNGYGVGSFAATGRTEIAVGQIETFAAGGYGIAAVSHKDLFRGGDVAGSIQVSSYGSITAGGMDAGGIVALSYTADADQALSGRVDVHAFADITASGQNAVGISVASSSAPVTVTVAAGARVMGGWSANPGDLSQTFDWFAPASQLTSWIGSNLPAAGIVVYSGAIDAAQAMTITNKGVIGALNDRAIAMGYACAEFDGIVSINNPCTFGMPDVQSLRVDNAGSVEGYVSFDDGARHIFENTGRFEVRHFADTDGDGVRDTKRVSISNFGAVDGVGAGTFNNQADGMVVLAPVIGAAVTDTTGFYTPTTGADSRALEGSFYNLNRDGVVQGQFVNVARFDNAGIIDLRGSAVGNTLVITGNAAVDGPAGEGVFVSNGGSLLLNAELNEGMVPSGQSGSRSDMLIVDTTAVGAGGATQIAVTNLGGQGGYTAGNGIELVEVRNKQESVAGAFVLRGAYLHDGQQTVVGGAYGYKLYHGGVDEDANDGNWYLRSQRDLPKPPGPLYQAGVPVYEAYAQSLLGLNGVSTLQQRVGNRVWSGNGNHVSAGSVGSPHAALKTAGTTIESNGMWGRMEGGHNHMQPRFSTSATNYNQSTLKMQGGLDSLWLENESGKLIGGLAIHYAHGKTKVSSVHGGGEITTDGSGLGGTLTWYGEDGIYVDGQAQMTWYRSDLNSTLAGRNLTRGNRGFGYALSLEGGQRIAINQTWSMTPQAQLSYSNVHFDGFTDTFNARVGLDRGESLQGRVGMTVDHEDSWQNANGTLNRAHIYGIANMYYEFLNGTQVSVSQTGFASRNDRLWGGLGMGGTYSWNDDKYSVYGEGLVRTSLNNFGDSFGLKAQAGFRMKW